MFPILHSGNACMHIPLHICIKYTVGTHRTDVPGVYVMFVNVYSCSHVYRPSIHNDLILLQRGVRH